jgi:hypothetical protein
MQRVSKLLNLQVLGRVHATRTMKARARSASSKIIASPPRGAAMLTLSAFLLLEAQAVSATLGSKGPDEAFLLSACSQLHAPSKQQKAAHRMPSALRWPTTLLSVLARKASMAQAKFALPSRCAKIRQRAPLTIRSAPNLLLAPANALVMRALKVSATLSAQKLIRVRSTMAAAAN